MARPGSNSMFNKIHLDKRLFGVMAVFAVAALILASGSSFSASTVSSIESSINTPINAPVFAQPCNYGYGYGYACAMSVSLSGRSTLFVGNLDMLHIRVNGGVTPYTSINLVETGPSGTTTIPLTLSNNGGVINYKFTPSTEGTYTFNVVVTDSNANTATSTILTVDATPHPGNGHH